MNQGKKGYLKKIEKCGTGEVSYPEAGEKKVIGNTGYQPASGGVKVSPGHAVFRGNTKTTSHEPRRGV